MLTEFSFLDEPFLDSLRGLQFLYTVTDKEALLINGDSENECM